MSWTLHRQLNCTVCYTVHLKWHTCAALNKGKLFYSDIVTFSHMCIVTKRKAWLVHMTVSIIVLHIWLRSMPLTVVQDLLEQSWGHCSFLKQPTFCLDQQQILIGLQSRDVMLASLYSDITIPLIYYGTGYMYLKLWSNTKPNSINKDVVPMT